jgi:hypothetical protein
MRKTMSFSSFWNGNTGRAIKRESANLAITSIWYVIIFTAVIVILNIVFTRIGLVDESNGRQLVIEYSMSFSNSCMWFILVCGIVLPLGLKNMQSFGLTRGQFTTGLIWAGALLSAGFTAFVTALSAVAGEFGLASVPATFLLTFSYWLFGWFTAVGFQYRNVFTASAGIALTVFLIYAEIRYVYVERLLGSWNESTGLVSLTAPGIIVFILADVLMATILRVLTRYIPVRC